MVQICLRDLATRFGTIRSPVLTRENPPSFNIQSMLLVKENYVRMRSNALEGHKLYSDSDGVKGRDHGRRGRFRQGRNNQGQLHEQNFYYLQDVANTLGMFDKRGSHHARPSRQNHSAEYGYCGKFNHYEVECRKKKSESALTSRQLTNYASNSDYDDHGGMFVMRHRANSKLASRPTITSNAEDVWFASSHTRSHQEWFLHLTEPDRPGYVETGDDATHPIWHVDNVPFGKEVKQTYIKKVLYVPTITKNLVSVGQIVGQGVQVRSNHRYFFIEKEGHLITRGNRE